MNLAVIGCGSRGQDVIGNLLKAGNGALQVCSVYDPNNEAADTALQKWGAANARRAGSMPEAISEKSVDAVMIFSPNVSHAEAVITALQAGKQVFAEKPLATNLDDCRKILAAEKESGQKIMTGFVLRYSPIYRKVKNLLDSGEFGRIVNISASENRISFAGGNSMSATFGWRRFREKGGPYLLEKCCHDFDLLNWFAGTTPVRVAGFGGLDYFIPENSHIWDKYDHDVFAKLVPEKYRQNPFTAEKNIFDSHSVILEYPNRIKMNFQLTLSNTIPERRMYISCTEGTIIVDSDNSWIKHRKLGEEVTTVLRFEHSDFGTHAGGDKVMATEVADALISGKTLAISGSSNALDCAIVALAADESMRTGKIIFL